MSDQETPENEDKNKEGKDTAISALQEELKNNKKETSRKMDNISDQLAQVSKQLEAKMAAAPPAKEPAQTQTQLADLMFDDHDKYVETIKKNTKDEIKAELKEEADAQAHTTTELQQIAAEFPDISEVDSELSIAARKILSKYPEEKQTDPMYMKSAVYEAAAKVGVSPKSQRKLDTMDGDDFTFNSRNNPPKPSKEEDGKVTELDKFWAENLQVDINSPHFKKNFAKYKKRDYSNYK